MITDDDLPREAREGPIFHPDWGTYAFERYAGNVRSLDALMAMVFTMDLDTERSEQLLKARGAAVEGNFSGPWAIDIGDTMTSWQVAMRVTAVEVYLQDALTFLALYDADFMRTRGSEQTWTYDDARTASDDNDTLWTFCSNWARAFVGRGGPRRWAESLEKSGLGRFARADLPDLEAMWGFRHLRVHYGHELSKEFALRHPEIAQRIWERGLQLDDLRRWAAAANGFVESAEDGIAGRLKGRLGEDLVGRREQAEAERQMAYWRQRYEQAKSIPDDEIAARIGERVGQAERRGALITDLFGEEQQLGDRAEWAAELVRPHPIRLPIGQPGNTGSAPSSAG